MSYGMVYDPWEMYCPDCYAMPGSSCNGMPPPIAHSGRVADMHAHNTRVKQAVEAARKRDYVIEELPW